jgi:hypothetical protein
MQMQMNCNCVSPPIAIEETLDLALGPKAVLSGDSDRVAGPKQAGVRCGPSTNRRLA